MALPKEEIKNPFTPIPNFSHHPNSNSLVVSLVSRIIEIKSPIIIINKIIESITQKIVRIGLSEFKKTRVLMSKIINNVPSSINFL